MYTHSRSLLSQYCTVLCNMPLADNFKKSVLLHCIYEWCHKYVNVVNIVLEYIDHYID